MNFIVITRQRAVFFSENNDKQQRFGYIFIRLYEKFSIFAFN